ncbi:MAG TPA: nicotinate-nucleotide adenylyltransferase [Dehalococcoidia bacterium]|jgi:nicotinate-nucleotide adenylyltransferase|nr:nicotinate-nucleotide adenylyltransferase [Dehalococcoidia bacterium]
MRQIGVLGGTFDPVHYGHLAIAEEARVQLGLDEVLFVPADKPYFKLDWKITPARHRLAMLRLAIQDNPYFKVSTIETDRPGVSYTVDTLQELRHQYGGEVEIYFILGWDAVDDFPNWHEPGRIVELAHLVAAARPGYHPDFSGLEAAIPQAAGQIIPLELPVLGVSSTEIRRRVRQGQSIRYLVPEAVERYIKEKRLYR